MPFAQRKHNLRISEYLSGAMLAIVLLFPLLTFAEVLPTEVPPTEVPPTEVPPTEVPPTEVPPVEVPPVEVPPAEALKLKQSDLIDTSRDYVSEKFVNLASEVDAFFGNDLNYQESNKSVLQIDFSRVFEKAGGGVIVPTFRAKLHLPAVQHRLYQFQHNLHILMESSPDRNLPGSGAGTAVKQGNTSIFNEVSTPDSYGLALRIENRDDSPWRFSVDGGLKLDNTSLGPFARTRASFTEQVGPVQMKLAESLFYFNTIGAGESTELDLDHRFSEPLLFRSASNATWLHDKQNFDLGQAFLLYHTLDERRSLLYQLSATGVSRPQKEVSEYVALVLYRQQLDRKWMFVELSPQLHYPKANNYQLNAQFIVRLEILFSK